THDNPIQDLEQLRERHRTTGLFKAWGCDSVEQAYVPVEDREGKEVKVPPCFDFLTEGDLLLRAGIPWAYYSATNMQNGYLWSAYDAVRHIRQDTQLWQSHVFSVDGLVQDVRDDRLPPVTWVTPRFELSEHPEYSFCWGQNWTTRIVNAMMSSPMWKDTAIFITWDDYGGFYDHVPPPQVDRFGFGIRVPLLLMSPYAKVGSAAHTLGEFSSVLRFIEDNWGLSQLTHRDRDARNLSEAFDFSQKPRKPDPQPVRTDCQGTELPDDPAPSVQGGTDRPGERPARGERGERRAVWAVLSEREHQPLEPRMFEVERAGKRIGVRVPLGHGIQPEHELDESQNARELIDGGIDGPAVPVVARYRERRDDQCGRARPQAHVVAVRRGDRVQEPAEVIPHPHDDRGPPELALHDAVDQV